MKSITCAAVVLIYMHFQSAISLAQPTFVAHKISNPASHSNEIHSRTFTIDTHVDIPDVFATPSVDPSQDGIAQVDFPKMERGGLDFVFMSVAVGQRPRNASTYELAYNEALRKIGAIQRMKSLYPDRIDIATSPSQARRVHETGRLVAAIGIENGFAIGKDINRLNEYRDLGVSYISVAHLGHNDIADSANPIKEIGDEKEEYNGISLFGREVVVEMNRLGLMIDVSHASEKAMMDIVDASIAPVIASHSGVRSLVDSPRNMSDEQLLALKDNRGVIQIIGYSSYIRPDAADRKKETIEATKIAGLTSHMNWVNATNEQYIQYSRLLEAIDKKYPRATVQDFVNHIDYVVQLIGIDHVGIGSDFYAGGGAAVGGLSGWMDASESPNITRELLRRGYNEGQIRKMWGENILRVWDEVKRTGQNLSSNNK